MPYYDLHSHSLASDGTLPPSALVRRAHRAGVDVLALTDHDETAGIVQARQTAAKCGLTLVPGAEISVTWSSMTIHVVGLGIDIDNAQLQAGLARLREFRAWRAEEIGRKLAQHGIEGAYESAKSWARGRIISRTHFAKFLVEKGYAKDTRAVFKHFLRANKPGHVAGQWASLEEAVGWIRGAGGQAVVAHPARYRLTATKMRALLSAFRECGGEGLEVVSGSHSQNDMRQMARLANKYDLLASAGSDYHGPGTWMRLGRLPPLPADCTPIWKDWDLPVPTPETK